MPIEGNYFSVVGTYTAYPVAKWDYFSVNLMYISYDDLLPVGTSTPDPNPDISIKMKISYNTKPFIIQRKNRKIYITQGYNNYEPVNYLY